MATNTIIIEFFGLPASGKSRLAEELKQELISEGKKTAVWKDITQSFKHSTIRQMLGSISFGGVLKYLSFFLKLPFVRERKWYMYWFAIKISLLYRYCRLYSDYDFILIDHGILQQAASLQCGRLIQKGIEFERQFINILLYEKDVDYCCNCIIDLNTAQQRMKMRDRKNEGRLDAITDADMLKKMYVEEEKVFFYILETAVASKNSWNFLDLDMRRPTEDLVMIVKSRICPEL